MNEWLIAATVLAFAAIPCLAVALLSPAEHGLAAVEIGGVLACTILVLLSEGFHRQPFIDLAVVLVPLSAGGSLAFVRFLARRR